MRTPLPMDISEWQGWFFKELNQGYKEDKTLIARAYKVGGEQARREVYKMLEDHKTDEEIKAYVEGLEVSS